MLSLLSSGVVVKLLIFIVQVLLLQPDRLEVLVGLPLHFLPHCLVSVVPGHLRISIFSVLLLQNCFSLLGIGRFVVNHKLHCCLVLSVTTRVISVFQDLHVWRQTRSTVSVISRLARQECLVLLDFVRSCLF